MASVKLSGPNPPHIGIYNYPGGRISGSYVTLEMLICDAYNVQSYAISGGPAWTKNERYDIEAKPPVSSKLSSVNPPAGFKTQLYDEQRQMLQSLLADRFQLKIHRETKQGPIYLLVKGSGPLKLEPPKDKQGFSWAGSVAGGPFNGDGIAGTNVSMPELAFRLSGFLRVPVLDGTGLDGSFDFKVKETGGGSVGPGLGGPSTTPPPRDAAPGDPAARLRDAIVQSVRLIGLKLDRGTGPVEAIVIDRVEKPSQN